MDGTLAADEKASCCWLLCRNGCGRTSKTAGETGEFVPVSPADPEGTSFVVCAEDEGTL
jgi:hypothetical protein